MLELFIVTFLVIATFYLASALYLFLAFLVVLVLVFPGMYAMLKGAPFLPTPQRKIQTMLDFANLKGDEIVVDLGCGNGRLVRAFARAGAAKAIGYELSIPTYLWAKLRSIFFPAGEEIIFANFWKRDLSDVDVIVCFLLGDSMLRFKTDIWPNLEKGTKVISNEFKIAGLKATKSENAVHLYVKNN